LVITNLITVLTGLKAYVIEKVVLQATPRLIGKAGGWWSCLWSFSHQIYPQFADNETKQRNTSQEKEIKNTNCYVWWKKGTIRAEKSTTITHDHDNGCSNVLL